MQWTRTSSSPGRIERITVSPPLIVRYLLIKMVDLSIKVSRKSTHTDQYLFFDNHLTLEHKLRAIRTFQDLAQMENRRNWHSLRQCSREMAT